MSAMKPPNVEPAVKAPEVEDATEVEEAGEVEGLGEIDDERVQKSATDVRHQYQK